MTTEPAEKPERLFIGVPLTADAREGLQKVLPRNLPGKLIPPQNWHFTLRFLGSTLPSARQEIATRLRAATCGKAFTIRFAELGAFPLPRRARILWVGVDEGAERLIQLAAIAEAAARSAGFAAEPKEFRPHLTRSRIEPPVSVKTLLSTNMKVGLRMPVTAVVLYRSRLGGGGPARYEEVERFELSPS